MLAPIRVFVVKQRKNQQKKQRKNTAVRLKQHVGRRLKIINYHDCGLVIRVARTAFSATNLLFGIFFFFSVRFCIIFNFFNFSTIINNRPERVSVYYYGFVFFFLLMRMDFINNYSFSFCQDLEKVLSGSLPVLGPYLKKHSGVHRVRYDSPRYKSYVLVYQPAR